MSKFFNKKAKIFLGAAIVITSIAIVARREFVRATTQVNYPTNCIDQWCEFFIENREKQSELWNCAYSFSLLEDRFYQHKDPKSVHEFVYYAFLYFLEVNTIGKKREMAIESAIYSGFYVLEDAVNDLFKDPLLWLEQDSPRLVLPRHYSSLTKEEYNRLCLEFYTCRMDYIKRKKFEEPSRLLMLLAWLPTYNMTSDENSKLELMIEQDNKFNESSYQEKGWLGLQSARLYENFSKIFELTKGTESSEVYIKISMRLMFHCWLKRVKRKNSDVYEPDIRAMKKLFMTYLSFDKNLEVRGVRVLNNPLCITGRHKKRTIDGYGQISGSQYTDLANEFFEFMIN